MRRMYEGIMPIDEKTIGMLPKLYAKVFAGEPWREASKCPKCGSFSGDKPESQTSCQTLGCSGTYSQEAYPVVPTRSYIQKELVKPGAMGIAQVKMEDVRMTIEQVLAFGWGFASSGSQLGKDKYQTDEMRKILSELLVKVGGFFYISEIGVDPQEQGKGIGKDITSRLAAEGKSRREAVVLRTNENSPMRYIAQSLGMKPIIGLKTGIKDRENEARVIFVGGKNA